jgi:HlyD family secretion protein
MRYTLAIAAFLLAGCSEQKLAQLQPFPQQTTVQASSAVAPKTAVRLAAQGRVEGKSDVISVGAGADGVVKWIGVKEGQWVAAGTKLAQIDCPELAASLREAEAGVEAAKQSKLRIARGSRDEERKSAEQRTEAARAVLLQAVAHLKRIEELSRGQVVSRAELDQAKRDHDVAAARLNETRRNEELVKAPALAEDIAKADAEIRGASEKIAFVKDKMTRCVVTAPITGTILRTRMRVGETFSTVAPTPLLEMADISTKRVRAEVDEKDVASIRIGQKVLIETDGNREARLAGRVESLSPIMGRKKVVSGDPSEKADRDVLEVLIALNGPAKSLPVGLRVIVSFTD